MKDNHLLTVKVSQVVCVQLYPALLVDQGPVDRGKALHRCSNRTCVSRAKQTATREQNCPSSQKLQSSIMCLFPSYPQQCKHCSLGKWGTGEIKPVEHCQYFVLTKHRCDQRNLKGSKMSRTCTDAMKPHIVIIVHICKKEHILYAIIHILYIIYCFPGISLIR